MLRAFFVFGNSEKCVCLHAFSERVLQRHKVLIINKQLSVKWVLYLQVI